jgi:predicted ATPase
MLCAAHRTLGSILFSLGAPDSAHTHFTQGIACDDVQQHRSSVFLHGEDAGVICRSRGAWALWCLGYPDQGLARSHEAVTLAQQGAHPLSLCIALSEAARFHQFRREVHATQEHVEAALRLATEQGFPLYLAYGSILRGWAFAYQGHAQEGLAQLHQGVIASRATGAETFRPYFLALLADVHGARGQPAAGLAALAEALAHADHTGERWYEPELYRLKGALLVQQSSNHHTEAETCFAHAIAIAQNQSAKSWELRAATSLARLWQQQGKRDEARQLLGDVYSWFTEGFKTSDLQEAQALLEGLS